jgi:hypothetical protein
MEYKVIENGAEVWYKLTGDKLLPLKVIIAMHAWISLLYEIRRQSYLLSNIHALCTRFLNDSTRIFV